MAVRQDRHMAHHLVVDELVRGSDLSRPVEHQYFSEERILEENEMLMLGVQLIEHPRDFVRHAAARSARKRGQITAALPPHKAQTPGVKKILQRRGLETPSRAAAALRRSSPAEVR